MNLRIFVFLLTAVCYFVYVESMVSTSEVPASVVETGAVVKEEPRKKQQDNNLMQRILPMLVTPFIMQVTILPMVLIGMKLTLLTSMFFGKLGVLLWIIHLMRNNNNEGGGLYSHNINVKHNDYEGHQYDRKNYQYSDHYNLRRKRDVLR